MTRRFTMVAAAVVALAAGACSSEQTRLAGTRTSESAPEAPTSLADTTPATEAPEVTTASSTTALPTTTLPSVPRGWNPIAPEAITGQAAPPCCASNWYGTASPPLPTGATPLPDGDYFARMEWAADPAQPLQLTVYRFEQCSLLPASACENPGGPYESDELGIDESASYPLTVPLDDHVRVVLIGFSGFTEDTNALSSSAEGNGTDLAELAVAVETAYSSVLAAPLEAGYDADAILADVSANPTGGFGPGNDGSEFSLSFTYGDAPPLLFQSPFNYDTDPPTARRGTDVLFIPSIEVVDGQLTVYVYAGFYS